MNLLLAVLSEKCATSKIKENSFHLNQLRDSLSGISYLMAMGEALFSGGGGGIIKYIHS